MIPFLLPVTLVLTRQEQDRQTAQLRLRVRTITALEQSELRHGNAHRLIALPRQLSEEVGVRHGRRSARCARWATRDPAAHTL